MKKFKFLSIFVIVGIFFSSSVTAQIKFGVQAGMNINSINQTVSSNYRDFNYPVKSKIGMRLGVTVLYEFSEQVGLESGLLYSQKGYQVDWDAFLKDSDIGGTVEGYWKNTYNYLEMPLHLNYYYNNFILSAGPYFAYGLGGTSDLDATHKLNGSSENIKKKIDLKAVSGAVDTDDFFYDDDDEDFELVSVYNAFDIGLDFGIGYKYQQVMLKAQYSIGLNNLTPSIKDFDAFDPDDLKKTNKGFNVSLIYFFTD